MPSTESASASVRLARVLAGIALAAALVVATLYACGFEFPIQFLAERESALLQAPEATFRDEVRRLVPAPSDAAVLQPVEAFDAPMDAAEAAGLSAEMVAEIGEMRALGDGDAAFARGATLPPDVRLYTAGAVSFRVEQMDAARARFDAVLGLPPDQRKRRELWARYMLGRLAARDGDAASAGVHFEAVRSLVRSGTPDPLGLAVASIGEEARVQLKAGAYTRAVHLYVQQASYGSVSAVSSLVRVASTILTDDALLEQVIGDELTRRVLFLFMHAHGENYALSDGPETDEPVAEPPALPPALDRVMAALERNQITVAAGAGSLAAVAYERGRFDLATQLAAREETALTATVRAKLALRQGDSTAALKAYGEAIAALRASGGGPSLTNRVGAEMALLHLGRDEFVQALDLLYKATAATEAGGSFGVADYWMDAAYVAERILTVDELKQYVDSLEAPTAAAIDEALERGSTLPPSLIRSVLGRRLMRAGRHAEALHYFDEEHTRSVAEEYVSTLGRANSRWRSGISRAEAWYSAATIARFDGMEILGFEMSPDYAVLDGAMTLDPEELDESEEPDEAPDAAAEPDAPASAVTDASSSISGVGTITAGEQARVTASKPDPGVRFHYRVTAVDHAMKAADLLPQSSQAFAAVLCRATSWVLDRQPERAAAVYERYLREGPYVRWARSFGRRCPQPDFDAAGRRVWALRLQSVVGTTRAQQFAVATGTLVLLVVALTAVARSRRRAAAMPKKEKT